MTFEGPFLCTQLSQAKKRENAGLVITVYISTVGIGLGFELWHFELHHLGITPYEKELYEIITALYKREILNEEQQLFPLASASS